MYPGDRYIIGYPHINIFFAPYIDLIFLFEGNKFKYFDIIFVFFLHNLKNYVRFLWFRNVDRIKFLIIEINAVFVVRFAHFAR